MTFFEDLFKDLHEIEVNFKNMTMNIKEKIQTLKLEVRYILPCVASSDEAEEEGYEELRRRFRCEDFPVGLDEFVSHLMKRTLFIKPQATDFYRSAYMDRSDWLKFTSYVLDNLKYVCSREANQTATMKEQAKAIEEKLTFLRTFFLFLVRRKYLVWRDVNSEKLVREIYDYTTCMFARAASLFQLFMAGKFDESKAEAMDLEFSNMLVMLNDGQLRAKEVYFKILKLFRSTSLVMCETLYCFINSLQTNLAEASTILRLLINTRDRQIREILLEIQLLRNILMDACKLSMELPKLVAISIHIGLLAFDAESVLCFSAEELGKQDNHESRVKVLDFIEKIRMTKHDIGESIRRGVTHIDSSIDDFLRCLEIVETRSFKCSGYPDTRNIKMELKFLRAFLRCAARWCIDHPQLGAIRTHIENVVSNAWWDLFCLCFRDVNISEEIKVEELECLFSDLLEKATLTKPQLGAIYEVCTQIRYLKPSPSTSPMSENFGVGFADALSNAMGNLQSSNPWTESFSLMKSQLDNVIKFLGDLLSNAAKLYIEDNRRNNLFTFLEDVTERAACLVYLQLVTKYSQPMSANQLLLLIKELGVRDIFVKLIEVPLRPVVDSDITGELLLGMVNVLIESLMEILNSDSSMVASMDYNVEILKRELIVLRCILRDPLYQYSDKEELDDLLNDIGAGIFKAGIIFCFLHVYNLKENIDFNVVEAVDRFRATVSQAYFKCAKLSPSKLPKSELGFLDITVANLLILKEGQADSGAFSMHQIGVLHDHLVICNSFLLDNAYKYNKGDEMKLLRAQIMNVGCKVENVINTIDEVPDWFLKKRISDVMEEVKLVKEEVTKVIQNVTVATDAGGPDEKARTWRNKYADAECFEDEAKAPEAQKEVMVSFEDEEQELTRKLKTGSQKLEIVSIVGMPGLGKTTLAMKVYKGVAESFYTHAWCYVSQNYEKKELLEHIINQINGPNSEYNKLNEEDLAQKLYQSLLKKKNYLIVLDDIWDIKAWNALKTCFPLGNNGSRILLTSRLKHIGLQASCDSTCIELKLLSIEKSLHLLENRVFGARSSPQQLSAVGVEIAKRSGGLPLAIVVLAGVLKNIEQKEHKWKQVADSLNSLLAENQDSVWSKLELSYSHLPVHLKQCFLYCGAFSKRKEFRRSKLVQLWVAEGFVEEKTNQRRSLEDVAESYFRDLVDRSLLIVTNTSSDDRIQSCRMHDLLRDFCLRKADEEKFLHTIDRWNFHPIWQWRLCFCSGQDEFVKFKHSLSSRLRTRSLMFFGTGDVRLYESFGVLNGCDVSFIHKNFKLLKVLDLECINVGSWFPEGMMALVSLRYLALQGSMNEIPSSIGKLVNLEIFIVRGILGEVQIPDSIFNLKKLRHLVVTNRAKVCYEEDCPSLHNLQSFSTPAFCRNAEQIIRRLPNLQKLNCIFMASNVFPALESLIHLQSLKAVSYSRARFPHRFSLPVNIKKLSLSKFRFPWSEMETIAALPRLEVLKLLVRACEGHSWDTSGKFHNLKYLRLDSLDFEEWEASDDHFPKLERLIIQRCKQLQSIPSAFSDIGNLKSIEVHWCSPSVAKSAKQIEYEQRYYSSNKQFKSITYPTEPDSFDEFSD